MSRMHERGVITLNRDESREWHDGPAYVRQDLRNAADIKAFAEGADVNVVDADGYTVHTSNPRTLTRGARP